MPRRWVWSLLDIAALICLGQATMLAQREAAGPPPRFDAAVELKRAEAGFGRFGTRIYDSGREVVVALHVPGQAVPPSVRVEAGVIRLAPRGGPGEAEEIPVPAGADAGRYRVRLAGDELRVIFAKAAPLAAGR
jgi:hypothetical protein